MRSWKLPAVAALAWLTLGVGTASAAWDNVFQACCFGCRKRAPAASFYVAPAAAPVVAAAPPAGDCGCASVSYSYVQRCYYEPVTTYKQTTYYEPVTSYRTSYYYEPVTTYRTTSYYDPCTGCCQRVCTPCTSYRLRSQCNAVVSYAQRCALTPVTSYRQAFYYEAVPTCTPCPQPCPQPCPPGGAVAAAPPVAGVAPAPAVTETAPQTLPPQSIPPAVEERKLPAGTSAPGTLRASPAAPPTQSFRPERVASVPGQGRFLGTVVANDSVTPKSGAQLTFVSRQRMDVRQAVQADANGRFNVALPAGSWWIYVDEGNGKPATYHSRLDVRGNEARSVTVVSR